MSDIPYLVAIALMEQNGRRAMPLCGKSLGRSAKEGEGPGEDGNTLALELLLRIWQRSDEGAVRRSNGDSSLLVLEIPMQVMSDQLPVVKANWVNGGSTQKLLERLAQLSQRAWRITIAKYEPVSFVPWP